MLSNKIIKYLSFSQTDLRQPLQDLPRCEGTDLVYLHQDYIGVLTFHIHGEVLEKHTLDCWGEESFLIGFSRRL